MTRAFVATPAFARTVVYLEDDRVELGSAGIVFHEELRRVAYRDVVAVLFHAARRQRYLLSAVTTAAFGGAAVAITAASVPREGATVALVGGVVVTLAAALLAWLGRRGTATGFVVVGTGGSIESAVGGSRATQERFRAELLAAVAAARAPRTTG